jgi:hypothetical protein
MVESIFYLLIIGIVTQVIMFSWIIVLHMKINKLRYIEKESEKLQQGTEDILMSFMLEIKEENEKFLKKVKNLSTMEYKEEKKEILAKHESSIDVKEETIEYKEFLPRFEESLPLPIEELVDQEEQTLENIAKEAERLLQEGHRIEEIAKRLNKGKTEIELLVKFRQSREK